MLDQLFKFLEQSLDDNKLSRGESAVFRDMLSESSLSKRERDLLRRKVYELVAERMKDPRDREVLEWTEDIHKALDHTFAPQDFHEEALFFPSDDSLDRLLAVLRKAKKSLDICVFTITDNRISRVILDKHNAGVKVRILSDDDKALDRGSDVIELAREGVPVRFDDSPDHMHHKFAILDGQLLLNGSFNWTRSASTRNQENLMILEQPGMVRAFQDEFERLWEDFAPGNR
ncbi:MAG: endonuclease [Deltaproteobacteria bacterium]|nr:MAG: endonuclease [Deltaproteobacteria bacterium]